MTLAMQALPVPPSLLGESPFWHPTQRALWWCDIPGCALNCFVPHTGEHRQWTFPCEPACVAPLDDGDLLLAMRDGLWRFHPDSGERRKLADPPYDPAHERFNDGRADPQGRLWVGTLYEPRDPPRAALYRYAAGQLQAMAHGITVSNGLAFSPDQRTMYWSDTKTHTIFAFDCEPVSGRLSGQRVFATFAMRTPGQGLQDYGGRPDGAAVASTHARLQRRLRIVFRWQAAPRPTCVPQLGVLLPAAPQENWWGYFFPTGVARAV